MDYDAEKTNGFCSPKVAFLTGQTLGLITNAKLTKIEMLNLAAAISVAALHTNDDGSIPDNDDGSESLGQFVQDFIGFGVF